MYLFEGIYIQCFDKKLKFCVNSAVLFVNTVFTVQAIVISAYFQGWEFARLFFEQIAPFLGEKERFTLEKERIATVALLP